MNDLLSDLTKLSNRYALQYIDEIFPEAQNIVEIGEQQTSSLSVLKEEYPGASVNQIQASNVTHLKENVADLIFADLFSLPSEAADMYLQKLKNALTDNSLLVLSVLSHQFMLEIAGESDFLDNETFKKLASKLRPLSIFCNEVPVKINNQQVTLFVYYLSTNKFLEASLALIKKIKIDAEQALQIDLAEKREHERDEGDESEDKETEVEAKEPELEENEQALEKPEAAEHEVKETEAEKPEAESEESEVEVQETDELEKKEPEEHEVHEPEREHEEEESETEVESEEGEADEPHEHAHLHAHAHEEEADEAEVEAETEETKEEGSEHMRQHAHEEGTESYEDEEEHEQHAHLHENPLEEKETHKALAQHADMLNRYHRKLIEAEEKLTQHHENTSSMLAKLSNIEKPEEKHSLIKKLTAVHLEHKDMLNQYKSLHEAHHQAYNDFMSSYEKGMEHAVSFGDKHPSLVPTQQARLKKQQALIDAHEELLQQVSQSIPRPG